MSGRIPALILFLGLYLGLHQGYLALWQDDSSEPIAVYPYHISLYPKTDKERLEKGIPISSKLEFSKCIEDYFS